MTWSAPMTAVASTVFTATQYNQFVRDNFLELFVAQATTSGQYCTGSGTNLVTPRLSTSAVVNTSENTTSTTYTDLATFGPSVTTETGTTALVMVGCNATNNTTDDGTGMSYEVSGATTIAVALTRGMEYEGLVANNANRWGTLILETALTPGTNTFTAKYRVRAGGTGTFQRREIVVVPLS